MKVVELLGSWKNLICHANHEEGYPRLWFYRTKEEEAPFAGCLPGHPASRVAKLAAQASRVRILYAPDEWDELELE
jgi:hypothetical protein